MNDPAEQRPLPPGMDDWIAALCAELGLDVRPLASTELLDVVRDVAHNVSRPAAPLSAYLIGLAVAADGGGKEAVLAAAAKARRLALTWPSHRRGE